MVVVDLHMKLMRRTQHQFVLIYCRCVEVVIIVRTALLQLQLQLLIYFVVVVLVVVAVRNIITSSTQLNQYELMLSPPH